MSPEPQASPAAGKPPVDARGIEGLWRRAWIRMEADGPAREDRDTRVYWFQGQGLYADLRVPEALVTGLAGAALADLDSPTLRALAACEGFAGRAFLEHDLCTWRRVINLAGPQNGVDCGRLEPTPEGLLEHGVTSGYTELWLADGPPPRAIGAGVFEDGQGRLAFLIQDGTTVLLACDRPARMREPLGFQARLARLLETGAGDREALADLFDAEYGLARLVDGAAIIEISTLPMRAGQILVERLPGPAQPLVTHHRSFEGRPFTRRWTPLSSDRLAALVA